MFMKGRLNVVKMSVLPNLIYKHNAISIKIPARYFVDIDKLIPKIWKDKKNKTNKQNRMANTILKKNKVGGLTLSDFKMYCKATAIKTVWYWQKNRQRDKWNRTEFRNRPL